MPPVDSASLLVERAAVRQYDAAALLRCSRDPAVGTTSVARRRAWILRALAALARAQGDLHHAAALTSLQDALAPLEATLEKLDRIIGKATRMAQLLRDTANSDD